MFSNLKVHPLLLESTVGYRSYEVRMTRFRPMICCVFFLIHSIFRRRFRFFFSAHSPFFISRTFKNVVHKLIIPPCCWPKLPDTTLLAARLSVFPTSSLSNSLQAKQFESISPHYLTEALRECLLMLAFWLRGINNDSVHGRAY